MSGASWREYGVSGLPPVLEAALHLFAERGYHGTSIRDLAAGAGLSVPGLYHHYRSKQEILRALLMSVMGDLHERSRAALASAGGRPSRQFDALVESLLRFHMFRRPHAFVASSEIRSLDDAYRAEYVALRDEQQRMVRQVVEAGRGAGEFMTPYPREAARAVATLCVGVATWYREAGPLTPDELIERHIVLARGLVGAL
ncbi:TetR/AcrR family transcriptional regulator [Dactylosporangium sp. NPDC000555]|uniref:TetR/AcrR family transcriptional regulator n=1 Tax=Dactylosporangium sp. NPDC000555 TaxID=3154260 RepID=UPI00332DECD2